MFAQCPPAVYEYLDLSGLSSAQVNGHLNHYASRGYEILEIDVRTMRVVMVHYCLACTEDHVLETPHYHCAPASDCDHAGDKAPAAPAARGYLG